MLKRKKARKISAYNRDVWDDGSDKVRKGYLDIGINPFRSLWNKIEEGGRTSGKEGEKKTYFHQNILLTIHSIIPKLSS